MDAAVTCRHTGWMEQRSLALATGDVETAIACIDRITDTPASAASGLLVQIIMLRELLEFERMEPDSSVAKILDTLHTALTPAPPLSES